MNADAADILLSDRQGTLFERLAKLGENARYRRLPVDVLEIFGFGSFFRGKDRPKDVDLVIRHTREPSPGFKTFLKLLELIRSNRAFQRSFSTPLLAMLHEFDKSNVGMLPIIDPADERNLFASWLHGYSWKMLFPDTSIGQLAWDDSVGFSRRLFRRQFPNLNVVYYVWPETKLEDIRLTAAVIIPIWSRERPDMRSNLLTVFEPLHIRECAQKEYANLDRQAFEWRHNVTVLQKVFALLRKTPRSRRRHSDPTAWWNKWAAKQASAVIPPCLLSNIQHDNWLLDIAHLAAEQIAVYQSPQLAEIPSNDLLALVDSRRKEVTHFGIEAELLREIIHFLTWNKANCDSRPLSLTAFLRSHLPRQKTATENRILSELLKKLDLKPKTE